MNRVVPRFHVALALAAWVAAGVAGTAAAQLCQQRWNDAGATMRQNCNVDIEDNSMCLVQTPVDVRTNSPIPYRFVREGDGGRIPQGLSALVGRQQAGGTGFTFLKVVTQGKTSSGIETGITQPIVLIAFGETTMREIYSPGPLEPPRAPCRGEMYTSSPSDGGVISRSASGRSGADQISVMLPQEEVGLLGRTAAGDMLLVRAWGATGWARAENIVMFVDAACPSVDVLPVFDPREYDNVFETPQKTTAASQFRLESRPVDDVAEAQCTLDGFPPSGMLIFNPSGTRVEFVVNDVTLRMGSSALVSQYRDVLSVVVLEGTVEVATGFGSRSARAGQAIYVQRNSRRIDVASDARPVEAGMRGPWCDQIYRLARAAFTTRGRLRVPVERINFCSEMPRTGYPLHPAMFDDIAILNIEVPDLRRRSYAEARQILADRGLRIGSVSGPQARDSYVAAQDPRPGTRVRSNSRVDLVLRGQEIPRVRVPDLRENSLTEARKILVDLGLRIGSVSGPQTRDSYIAAQEPPPGTQVRLDSEVDVVLKAPTPTVEMVTVPDVRQALLRDAIAQLERAGLKSGQIDGGQTGDASYVVDQSPQPQSRVPVGSTVDLRVRGVIQ